MYNHEQESQFPIELQDFSTEQRSKIMSEIFNKRSEFRHNMDEYCSNFMYLQQQFMGCGLSRSESINATSLYFLNKNYENKGTMDYISTTINKYYK